MINNLNNDSEVFLNKAEAASIDNRSADISIYSLILVIMVSVGRIQEIIPGLSALKLGKVSFGLGLVLLFTSPKNNDIRIFSMPQLKCVVALYLLGMISAVFSYWPGKSFNFMLFSFPPTLILLFLVVKNATKYKDLVKISWGIVVSLTLLGIMALLSGGERVAASSTYDPNDLALVLVVFLPLFYFMMINQRGLSRFILFSALSVSLAAILATQSRGGFLGISAVVLGIAIKEKMSLSKLVLGCGFLLLAFMYFTPAGYGERMSSIITPEKDYNRTASGGRFEIWKRGLQLMAENPVLGVGPFVFEVAEGTKHIDEATGTTGKWSSAHNCFVQIGTEFGIPGLVLFVIILISSIGSLRKLNRALPVTSNLRWLGHALEIGFYGYIVCGFFLSQAYSSALFLLVGLTIALVNQAKRHDLPLDTLQF